MNEYGFTSAINSPTRIQGNSKSCLDHIFIKSKERSINDIVIPMIIETSATDHYSVAIQVVQLEKRKYQ